MSFPAPTLQTQRLRLQPSNIQDEAALLALTSNPDVMKFYPYCLTPQSLQELLDRVQKNFDADGFGLWNVYLKNDTTLLGQTGILRPLEPILGPDIGFHWRFFPQYQGQGYAQESAQAVIDYAFNTLKLDQVVARISPANIPSIKVAQKLGMTHNPAENFEYGTLFPAHHPYRTACIYRLKNPLN